MTNALETTLEDAPRKRVLNRSEGSSPSIRNDVAEETSLAKLVVILTYRRMLVELHFQCCGRGFESRPDFSFEKFGSSVGRAQMFHRYLVAAFVYGLSNDLCR